jgi:DNA-binding GntR family transcriptional regulator
MSGVSTRAEHEPRYLTIEHALRAEIARLQPNDPLPTEAELCRRFGVSRMTAREGIRRLVDQGLLYRVRGRVETRVVYDTDNTPIEQTETRYSPTRFILDVELHRPG